MDGCASGVAAFPPVAVGQLHEMAGVPEKYRGWTVPSLVDQAEQRFERRHAEAYAANVTRAVEAVAGGRWATVLQGKAGTGKSALGAALMLYGRGVPGWLSAAALVNRMRDGELELDDVFVRCSFLVLDDLGAEYATTFSNSQLDAFIAEAYERRFPVVITTNCGPEQVAEFYTERMLDRLSEDSAWVTFTNPSFRRL